MTYKSRLVGYWPLDEDSGSTAYDYSGNENDGTANGAGPSGTGTVSGPLEATAYDFDGSDDDVDILDSLTLSDFTLSCWVNTTNSSGDESCIRQQSEGTNSNYYFIRVRGNDTGQMRFGFRAQDGTTYTIDSGTNVNNGEWRHVLGVRNGSDLRIYVDGKEDGENTGTTSNTINSGEDLRLGSFNGSQYFDGSMCECRIYDRALSPTEIQHLYNISQSARLRTSTKTA